MEFPFDDCLDSWVSSSSEELDEDSTDEDFDDDDDTATATKDDKLMALLKNQVSTTTSTKPIYSDRKQYYCRSSFYGQLQALRGFIDENEVDQFQLKDRGPFAVYCRGISLMPNRNSRRKRNHRYILSLNEIV